MEGSKLGRYEIVEELGRGAMGTVWLAQDPALGRLVALKTLPAGPGRGLTATACFLREARAAGGLDHPRIVTIHDVHEGGDGEPAYIAMEYVSGSDLSELLRPGLPLPADFVLKVVGQVAEALDYAHRHEVVHRDVKPGNILITAEEEVKLTDFGLATTAAGAGPFRHGTPQYVAPEQLLGKRVDRRADVFSLAVVAYEALAGRRPFEGADAREIVRRVAHEPPTPPGEHGVELPAAAVEVLFRALEKEPVRRFTTAGELARSLARALRQADGAATQDLSDLLPELPLEPPAAALVPMPPRRLPRRRRGWRWAAGLLLVLAASASGWALVGDGPTPPAPERVPLHPPLATPPPAFAEALAEARARLEAGDPASAARFAALARELSPHRDEASSLDEQIAGALESKRRDQDRREEIDTLLRLGARAARAERWDEARAVLGRLEQLRPGRSRLAELRRRIDDGETTAAERRAAERAAAAAAEERARRARTPTARAPAEPPPDWSELQIDFFSQLPRGVVTVYAGDEQIASEPFRFGKKGLFRRADGAGRLEIQRRLGVGEIPLRVYLSLPGRPAASRSVLATFRGGTERVLRVLVDARGELSIRLD